MAIAGGGSTVALQVLAVISNTIETAAPPPAPTNKVALTADTEAMSCVNGAPSERFCQVSPASLVARRPPLAPTATAREGDPKATAARSVRIQGAPVVLILGTHCPPPFTDFRIVPEAPTARATV